MQNPWAWFYKAWWLTSRTISRKKLQTRQRTHLRSLSMQHFVLQFIPLRYLLVSLSGHFGNFPSVSVTKKILSILSGGSTSPLPDLQRSKLDNRSNHMNSRFRRLANGNLFYFLRVQNVIGWMCSRDPLSAVFNGGLAACEVRGLPQSLYRNFCAVPITYERTRRLRETQEEFSAAVMALV